MREEGPHPAAEAVVIVGPTASGKSAVAQWLAETAGFDSLSADSMLVYRGTTEAGRHQIGRALILICRSRILQMMKLPFFILILRLQLVSHLNGAVRRL